MVLEKHSPKVAFELSPPYTPADPAHLDLTLLVCSLSDDTEVGKATASANSELRQAGSLTLLAERFADHWNWSSMRNLVFLFCCETYSLGTVPFGGRVVVRHSHTGLVLGCTQTADQVNRAKIQNQTFSQVHQLLSLPTRNSTQPCLYQEQKKNSSDKDDNFWFCFAI